MDYIVMKVRWGIVYLHISFFDSINFIIFKTFIKALFWRIYTINFYVTECGEGWYGTNCSQQCLGHCRDGTTCNHVTVNVTEDVMLVWQELSVIQVIDV